MSVFYAMYHVSLYGEIFKGNDIKFLFGSKVNRSLIFKLKLKSPKKISAPDTPPPKYRIYSDFFEYV